MSSTNFVLAMKRGDIAHPVLDTGRGQALRE